VRILAVDDDPCLLELLSVKFRAAGIDCDTAECLSETAEMLRRHRYDGILLDVHLGEEGGLDALPNFLKDICISEAERDELVSLLDGVLSALYRQRGVGIMGRFNGASAVWGDPGWTDIHPHYRGGADHGEELTLIYCASGMNLDVPRLYQRQTITMRIFDILASGGFVLAERSAALEAVFEEDRHLAYYDSHDNLNEVLGQWVNAPLERETIAKAGRQEVLNKHQIRHRVETILNAVQEQGW